MQATLIATPSLVRESRVVSVGIFCFVVLTTISGLVTTYESRDAIHLFRLIAAMFVLIATLFVFARFRIARPALISLFLYLFVFLYATIAASFSGGLEISGQSMPVDFLISLCGLVLFCARFYESGRVLSDEILVPLMAYAIGVCLLTLVFGGFTLDFPPRFVFEVASDEIGREENYSLGITSFFIFASIFASIGFSRSGISFKGFIYFTLLLFFLFFSFLGGGRGEIAVGFLMISFVLLKERKIRSIAIAVLSVGALMALMVSWDALFESVVVLQRFQLIFEGDMSSRDLLLVNVFGLLSDQPSCLFLGCGPGFFQKYYDYGFGFYPHNSIAEALLIFGLPFLMLLLLFSVYGFFRYYKAVGRWDLFMLFFLYNFLVSLKSGYFFGSWVLVVGIFFFIGVGLRKFSSYDSSRRRLITKSDIC